MTTYTLSKTSAAIDISIMDNDEVWTTLTGAVQVQGRTGNRFKASLHWSIAGAQIPALQAELDQLLGKRNRLLIPASKWGYVRGGVGGGTPLVNGAVIAGQTTLPLKGLPSSTTGILQPGDYIQIGNQLVRTTGILTSSGTTGTVGIRPELHKNYADGTAVNYTTPGGVFILLQDAVFSYGVDKFADVTADFMEDVLA